MNWKPYRSVLAGSVGVRDEDAEHPMDTFRPCDSDEEAGVLAAEMQAAGYDGDGIDYVRKGEPSDG